MSKNVVDFAVASNRRKITLFPSQAEHYYNLALSLEEDERVSVEINAQKKIFDRKDLLIRAIELNQGIACAYNNLANLLTPEETIYLHIDGSVLGCNQFILYQLALACDINYAPAYCNLAVYLQKKDQDKLTLTLNGRSVSYTAKELYLEAIYSDPTLSVAYSNLALCLTPDNPTIRLRIDGEMIVMNERDLYIKAIELDASNAEAFYNLSTTIKEAEEGLLIPVNGKNTAFNRIKLLTQTLRVNSRHANAYYNLAVFLTQQGLDDIELDPGSTGTLKRFSILELYQAAITYDAHHFLAMYNLAAHLLPEDQATVFINGEYRRFDKQSLYLEVIRLKPGYVEAYYNLALTLPASDAQVQVSVASKQHQLTQRELFELVIGLDDQHHKARCALIELKQEH